MLNPTPISQSGSLHSSLVSTLVEITEPSSHSHEAAMHRLLLDLGDLLALGHLNRAEYAMIVGMAMDVLFYFNYDIDSLAAEPDRWYRAAVIHQMGQAMLQAVAIQRPEYTAKTFYREAMAALSLERHSDLIPASPLQWRQWPSCIQASA